MSSLLTRQTFIRLIGLGSGDNVDGTTNIIPNMGLEALLEGYKGLMLYLYSPQHYYARVKAFMREYSAPKTGFVLDFQRLLAFFRSILRLGIFGEERIEYWKILVWTLFRRPRSLVICSAPFQTDNCVLNVPKASMRVGTIVYPA